MKYSKFLRIITISFNLKKKVLGKSWQNRREAEFWAPAEWFYKVLNLFAEALGMDFIFLLLPDKGQDQKAREFMEVDRWRCEAHPQLSPGYLYCDSKFCVNPVQYSWCVYNLNQWTFLRFPSGLGRSETWFWFKNINKWKFYVTEHPNQQPGASLCTVPSIRKKWDWNTRPSHIHTQKT